MSEGGGGGSDKDRAAGMGRKGWGGPDGEAQLGRDGRAYVGRVKKAGLGRYS